MIQILFRDPLLFLFSATALIICLTVHEFFHAWASHKLGDDTAKYLGRLSLNPMRHLDPIGTVMLILVGFGWGKPVPFNPLNLKDPKRDSALVALAGPVSNLGLAFIFTLIFHLIVNASGLVSLFTSNIMFFIAQFCLIVINYNLVLCFFNLIPVFPLDGFRIVEGFLPYPLSSQWSDLARYGVFILLALLLTGAVSIIITPFINLSFSILQLPL